MNAAVISGLLLAIIGLAWADEEKATKHVMECWEETNPKTSDLIKYGDLKEKDVEPMSHEMKAFNMCLMKKMGVLNSNGDMQPMLMFGMPKDKQKCIKDHASGDKLTDSVYIMLCIKKEP